MASWVVACGVDDLAERPVVRFDHGDRSFAIYRSPEGAFYATEGFCTHERTHLSGGLMLGHEIECPLHFGAFDYRTGEAVLAPACVDLKTFEVRVDGDAISILIDT